jgi:hypothetical protein
MKALRAFRALILGRAQIGIQAFGRSGVSGRNQGDKHG